MNNSKRLEHRKTKCKGLPWLLCALVVVVVEARPVARWANPCELPPMLDVRKMSMSHARPDDAAIADDLASRTEVALNQARRILQAYVDDSFTDASFIEGTTSHRLSFLPKVTRSAVKDMTLKQSVVYFYTVMQYYGVGLEQVITDQVLHDGQFFLDFRDVENKLAQVLCELQMSAAKLHVTPNADVTRDVMKEPYRKVGSTAQRLIRNYLILRDYVQVLQVMYHSFTDLRHRTLPS